MNLVASKVSRMPHSSFMDIIVIGISGCISLDITLFSPVHPSKRIDTSNIIVFFTIILIHNLLLNLLRSLQSTSHTYYLSQYHHYIPSLWEYCPIPNSPKSFFFTYLFSHNSITLQGLRSKLEGVNITLSPERIIFLL